MIKYETNTIIMIIIIIIVSTVKVIMVIKYREYSENNKLIHVKDFNDIERGKYR